MYECICCVNAQVHARMQTIQAMTLYMCHVTRKAWKALVLFYWQSVAERQQRKLIQLQNLRYRSDATFPKVQKLLKTPAGFKNHTLDNQEQRPRHFLSDALNHPELLTIDMISSDEEDNESVDSEGICQICYFQMLWVRYSF